MVARARFSISFLMAVVLFVAADFAIMRVIRESLSPALYVVALATLPMINVLLLALPKLKRAGDARPFWLGFEVVGWSILFLFGLVGWFQTDMLIAWFTDRDPFQPGTVLGTAFLISFTVVFYTVLQILAAVIGGLLSARYRVVVERRSLVSDRG